MKVNIDFESRSRLSIKKLGMHRYMECADFMPLMACYRVDGGEMRTWLYTDRDCPADLRAAIEGGAEIHAYNAIFEVGCLNWLTRNWSWPTCRLENVVDTAAAVAALGLPRALGDAAEIMGLPVQKDDDGKRLIKLFCRPTRKGDFNHPADFPEDWQRFQEYCATDVLVEEELARRVPPLSAAERRIWLFNARTNARGIRVDVNALIGAKKIAAAEKLRLDSEMRIATNGAITSCSQIKVITEWLGSIGYPMASLDKSSLAAALERPDLPVDARRVLELRREAAKTSVAKLNAMLNRASPDGRVRGTAIYHGASTGRETSVGVNFFNTTRPSKQWEDATDPKAGWLDKAALFRAIRSGDPAQLPEWKGGAMQLLSDAVRGFVWSAPGRWIVQADYSNIEGVFAAWFAGEEWKIQAYREIFSNPDLPDMYRRTAARMLGLTTDIVTKKHPARQSVGKLSELLLQYSGGVSAFYVGAKSYGTDLEALFDIIAPAAPEENMTRARKRWKRCVTRGEHKADVMSEQAWLACELVKIGWRQDNAQIAGSWVKLEDAMREAVLNPGKRVDVLRVSYRVAHDILWCRLPSGRPLAYHQPRLRDCSWVRRINLDGTLDDAEAMDSAEAYMLEERDEVRIEGPAKARVTVAGLVDRKWRRSAMTGGLALENISQGGCRDILFNGLVRLEDRGWETIFSVYDEAVAEADINKADLGEFERLLCQLEPEYAGFPLASDGFLAKRYRK